MQTYPARQAPRRRASFRPAVTLRFPACCLLLSLLPLACASIAPKAARVREEVIGLRASTLQTCLGEAPYFEVLEDGSELWGYTDRSPDRGQSIEVSRALGQGTRFQRPRVEAGILDEEADSATGSIAIDLENVPAGQCVFIFSIDAGQVRSLEVRGRARSGLNADAACTTLIDRCIPSLPENREDPDS